MENKYASSIKFKEINFISEELQFIEMDETSREKSNKLIFTSQSSRSCSYGS